MTRVRLPEEEEERIARLVHSKLQIRTGVPHDNCLYMLYILSVGCLADEREIYGYEYMHMYASI
jgi:hypothetical protein